MWKNFILGSGHFFFFFCNQGYKRTVSLFSASGPGDFCVKKSGFKFCFDFYNVDLSDLSDPDMCIKVKAKVLNKTVARVNLGCI